MRDFSFRALLPNPPAFGFIMDSTLSNFRPQPRRGDDTVVLASKRTTPQGQPTVLLSATGPRSRRSSIAAVASSAARPHRRSRGCRGRGSLHRHRLRRQEERRNGDNDSAASSAEKGKGVQCHVQHSDQPPPQAQPQWQQHIDIGVAQMNAWCCRTLLVELHTLIKTHTDAIMKQTEALQRMTTSVQKLVQSEHIARRHQHKATDHVKQPKPRSRSNIQCNSDYEKVEADLTAKLNEILASQERCLAERDVTRQGDKRPTEAAEEQVASHIRKLRSKMESKVTNAVKQLKQYERCPRRKVPCKSIVDLVREYNEYRWDRTLDRKNYYFAPPMEDELFSLHSFYDNGTIKDTTLCFVDPIPFHDVELYRPRYNQISSL